MKKIYSPLLEGLLALYLGFEWIQVTLLTYFDVELITKFSFDTIKLKELFSFCFDWQTNNILSPIITHGIYSAVILGHGLWKIHDHRRRLHQRIHQLESEGRNSDRQWRSCCRRVIIRCEEICTLLLEQVIYGEKYIRCMMKMKNNSIIVKYTSYRKL